MWTICDDWTAERIKRLRQGAGMSQEVFGGLIGLNAQEVDKLERLHALPNTSICRKLNELEERRASATHTRRKYWRTHR